MLGVAGVDLGPFSPLEQASLAEVATPKQRNLAFGRYALVGGLFNASGGLAAGTAGSGSLRGFFLLYAVIGLATAILPALMSPRAESDVLFSAAAARSTRAGSGVSPTRVLTACDCA